MTPNDLWPPPKTIGIIYSIWPTHTPNMRLVTLTLLEIPCLQAIFKVFTIWPLVTSNDLWPPRKIIGIIYPIRPTHTPNMTSLAFTLLEISCLQGFRDLTSGDLKWPLTSTKNDRVLLLNMTNPYAKYENCRSLLTWDIVFTRFFGFWPLVTSNDLWPAPKTIGFFLSTWQSYIPNMKSVGQS